MAEYRLAAEPRTETGKGAAHRIRAAGRVPAVLYGHGAKPKHLTVDAREFSHALRTDAGSNVLIALQVGKSRQLALAKEIQRHPVRGNFIHVDFLVVRRGEKVQVSVQLRLVGESPGVREGGVSDQDLYQIRVEAEVTAVPDAIDADISALGIGDVLRVRDLVVPEGVTILDDPEASVVSVVTPRVEPEPVAEAEEGAAAAEGAEGAEGAAAEGGEASAGGGGEGGGE